MKTALVCGAGGFIGGHMAKRLKEEGYWVRGVDLVPNEFMNMEEVCDEFFIGDLRDTALVSRSMKYISLPQIWAAQVLFSQERTMLISCTTLLKSILTSPTKL